MKRKYVAMALGVMLAFSSMCVYAEESSEASAEEMTFILEENMERLYGEVTKVEDGAISLSKGSLDMDEFSGEAPEGAEMEMTEKAEKTEKTETAEGTEKTETAETSEGTEKTETAETSEGTEKTETAETSEDTEKTNSGSQEAEERGDGEESEADEDKDTAVVLTLSGEEETVTLADDAVIQRLVKPADVVVSEGSEKEASGVNEAEDADAPGEGSESASEINVEINLDSPFDGLETEDISLKDIREGDLVSIVLDEEGKAASITVISFEENEMTEEVVTEAE